MSLPVGNYVKVNLVGHLTGGEQFVTGFWVSTATELSQTELNSLATSIAGLITATTFTNTRSIIDSGSGYDKVVLYQYVSGGPRAARVSEATMTGVVGTGTTYHPLQTAVVISLRTQVPGASNRGRMYIPFIAAPLGADHQVGSSSLDAVLVEWQTFLNAVNQIATVAAVTVISRVGAGKSTAVTQLIADTRTDVQRRRANKEVITAKVTKSITQ